jgi:UDP-N-acetylglucosamine--N-acetylmuramyl-(pentapeptide) pyrophosphoryl-undecaprenol N-acetylglucosamine transferase
MTGPIMLASGGTGGHLFPARALARCLIDRDRSVVFITDRRGADLGVGLEGVPVHTVRSSAMAGRKLSGRLTGAVDLLLGTWEARRLTRQLGACCAVGFGGYPSVPPVLAAGRLALPCVIHEQNAVLGRANRLLAPRVDVVATSFTETARLPSSGQVRVVVTGNPVRPDIAALASRPYAAPNGDGRMRVLIIGGSQGARVLSDVVPEALRSLPSGARCRLALTQQCRAEDLERVRATYDELGVQAELATFFDDMAARLGEAQLVISRAGASSVAEIAAAGKPAILVPYRFAADDHQTANAAAFEADGAAWMMPEAAFTPEALAARLEALIAAPQSLEATAEHARRRARLHAAEDLADVVERLAPGNGGRNDDDTPLREEAA